MSLSEPLWGEAILSADATIEQAIQNLNVTALKIIVITDEKNIFQGTISDGDIRRGLIDGLNLHSSVATIIHHDAVVVSPELDRESVVQLMITKKVQQIPVVDDRKRVVGLHLWDEITAIPIRSNLMIIMAGGLGSRLRPYTNDCPKPLLSIAGKPMLEHIIERARREGFRHFVLAIGYLGHMIEAYFGDGARLGVQIDYVREDAPLGTAGALALLQPTPQIPFIVTNGDVITDIRYGELLDFHVRCAAAATMAVHLHEWAHPFGVVHMRGVDIVGFDEKPTIKTHVNAGVYALDPSALFQLSPNEYCDMPAVFERMRERGQRTVAYSMHEPWLDVGNPDDLKKAIGAVHNAALRRLE
jgi:dTDP-glucose pyrophosphorylase